MQSKFVSMLLSNVLRTLWLSRIQPHRPPGKAFPSVEGKGPWGLSDHEPDAVKRANPQSSRRGSCSCRLYLAGVVLTSRSSSHSMSVPVRWPCFQAQPRAQRWETQSSDDKFSWPWTFAKYLYSCLFATMASIWAASPALQARWLLHPLTRGSATWLASASGMSADTWAASQSGWAQPRSADNQPTWRVRNEHQESHRVGPQLAPDIWLGASVTAVCFVVVRYRQLMTDITPSQNNFF